MQSYIYICGTLLFTLYGQIIIKWRADIHKADATADLIRYLFSMLTDIGVISGLMAAGLAAICWFLTLRSFSISYAYPFMSLTFILIPVLGWLLFGEGLSWQQLAGSTFIMLGIALHVFGKGRI